jgi:hypothetical protein
MQRQYINILVFEVKLIRVGEALTKSRKSLALTTAEVTFFDAMVDEEFA